MLESVEDGDYALLLGEGWEGDEDAPTVIHMGENPTKHLALAAGLRHVGIVNDHTGGYSEFQARLTLHMCGRQ